MSWYDRVPCAMRVPCAFALSVALLCFVSLGVSAAMFQSSRGDVAFQSAVTAPQLTVTGAIKVGPLGLDVRTTFEQMTLQMQSLVGLITQQQWALGNFTQQLADTTARLVLAEGQVRMMQARVRRVEMLDESTGANAPAAVTPNLNMQLSSSSAASQAAGFAAVSSAEPTHARADRAAAALLLVAGIQANVTLLQAGLEAAQAEADEMATRLEDMEDLTPDSSVIVDTVTKMQVVTSTSSCGTGTSTITGTSATSQDSQESSTSALQVAATVPRAPRNHSTFPVALASVHASLSNLTARLEIVEMLLRRPASLRVYQARVVGSGTSATNGGAGSAAVALPVLLGAPLQHLAASPSPGHQSGPAPNGITPHGRRAIVWDRKARQVRLLGAEAGEADAGDDRLFLVKATLHFSALAPGQTVTWQLCGGSRQDVVAANPSNATEPIDLPSSYNFILAVPPGSMIEFSLCVNKTEGAGGTPHTAPVLTGMHVELL